MYSYDIQDNLASVMDPNLNTTTYSFDDFHRMKQQTSPVTGTTTYTYDPAGNLTTTTDANGSVTTQTFDADNRALTDTSTNPNLPEEDVAWTYDDPTSGHFGKGRLATMTDPTGNTTYTYERRGLIASENPTILGTPFTMTFAYDLNGNRSQITYPSGRILSYTFDYANRPFSLSGVLTPNTAVNYVLEADYLPFGPLRDIYYGTGLYHQGLSYDARYRILDNSITTIPRLHAVKLFNDYTYAEDGIGNITQLNEHSANYNRTFAYDDLNRLITANTGGALWGNGSYTYDLMGNVTSLALGTSRADTFAYQQNGHANNLPLLTSVDGLAMTYDAAGNETDGRDYSSRNLMADISVGGVNASSASYLYDGRGVRTVTTSTITQPLTIRTRLYYFYLPESRLLGATNGVRLDFGGTYAPLTDYIWFGDRPVAREDDTDATKTATIITDHLRTPIMELASDGQTILWQVEYEPYGNVYSARVGLATDEPLRFPGQEDVFIDDTGTAVHYNIFRWYRSGWGRYSQPDPQGLNGGANLFKYAHDNPTRYMDPLGLWTTGGPLAPAAIANTIVCDGRGHAVPHTTDLGSGITPMCIADCVVAHEQSHARDAQAANPGVCAGKLAGLLVLASSEAERSASEVRASTVEINCLRKMVGAGAPAPCCAPIQRQVIQQMINYRAINQRVAVP